MGEGIPGKKRGDLVAVGRGQELHEMAPPERSAWGTASPVAELKLPPPVGQSTRLR